VVSERAETASRLINLTLGLHRTQLVTVSTGASPPRLGDPFFDGTQVQRQATWLRMISVTENFCADRLLEAAEAEIVPSESVVRSLVWDKASTVAIGSWPAMKEAYNSWFGVKPDWAGVEALIQVRNAIAHGLGELTRLQLRKRPSTAASINRAGVVLADNRIILSEENMQDARDCCAKLIESLDIEVSLKTAR
jgi:hypothetical protein